MAAPFGGRGPAGAAWKLAVGLFVVAAGLMALYALLLFQVQAWPRDGDQDGRTWEALAAGVFGAMALLATFVAWTAANVLAGFRLGRLARPVLALGGAVGAAVAIGCLALLPTAVSRVLPAAFLALGCANVAGAVAAWRATPSTP